MALKMDNFFGTTPEFWLSAQNAYDLYVTYKLKKQEIDNIKKIA